jgi:GH25 family lysozyme M1 (1,4-beta-N-acetylmuramidase)
MMARLQQVLGFVACAAGLAAMSGCNGSPDDLTAGDGAATREDAVRVCAEGTTVKGVDVSFYQGDVSWSKVKGAGYKFAFARVSDGTTHIDDKFDQNWANLKANGLVRGAYQFFRPSQSAEAQADIMIQALGQLGDGDLPAVLDAETADGQSSATIVSKMKTWLDLVEQGTGRTPIIYTAVGFWGDLSGTGDFAGYPLWVANYGVSCPYVPDTWAGWSFWQYTESGSVPGIAGGVDTNYFNGTLDDLLAMAKKPVTAAPMGVSWTRQADGSYKFQSTGAPNVSRVEYWVDGYKIGEGASGSGFSSTYTFSLEKNERQLEARGYDAQNAEVAKAIGLLDVTPGVGVFIRQTGAKEYEIGLERAPAGVAAIEVKADGYLLTDGISGTAHATRLAVKYAFEQLGQRQFALTTYNADGSVRGTLYRTFSLL